MNIHPFAGTFPMLFLLAASMLSSGRTCSAWLAADPGNSDFFLYVEYCGSRYNKSNQCRELVIRAVKLPAHLLKKMPRMRDEGQYSSRNLRIRMKQQEIADQFGTEKMTVRVNESKFNAFYPNGLKRGCIIELDEFNRWDFLETPVPELPPVIRYWWENYQWEWNSTDPVNISFGMPIRT